MAERGEGAAPQGGSYTCTTTSVASTNTRDKLPLLNKSKTGLVGEGAEGAGSPLPLRKRKFNITDQVTSKRPSGDVQEVSPSSTPSSKRRRLTAGCSTSDQEAVQTSGGCAVDSPTSPVVRKRRGSRPECQTSTPGSLAAQAPDTPSRGQSATASPPPQRSSTRVSVSPGFYTDIEQRFRVAEWERAWSRPSDRKRNSGEHSFHKSSESGDKIVEAKSDRAQAASQVSRGGEGRNKLTKVGRPLRASQNNKANKSMSVASTSKPSNYRYKYSSHNTAKDAEEPASENAREGPNRRRDQYHQSAKDGNRYRKSAGNNSENNPNPKVNLGATPKVKSSETNKMRNVNGGASFDDDSRCKSKSKNHPSKNGKKLSTDSKPSAGAGSSNDVGVPSKSTTPLNRSKLKTGEEERSPGGTGLLKSYPLRNRLRLSEGNHVNVGGGTNNNGSIGSLNSGGRGEAFNHHPPYHNPPHHHQPPPPSQHPHNPQHQQSQSLPSSPSSQGVAFLADTFRRLRDSRRSSNEPTNAPANTRRSGQPKEPAKQSTGSWKRGYGTRKSPLSKRSSRGKANNTGSCASSGQHAARCTKVGVNSSAGMSGPHGSGGHAGSSSGNPSSGSSPNPATLNLAASNSSVAVPPTTPGLAAIMTTGPTTSASTILTPTSFTTFGAIGGSSSSGAGSSASSTVPGGLASFMGGGPTDSESEENEMGRLEALLASRGLSPSLFGALGPRMQHLLHRSVSSSISSRAQQLLIGLQATGDESEQLQAVIEMCQLLVMGNEDTLAGFPIKQVTPALINLLNMDHNFDMMNHACRALTYMMEALPRSSSVVVDAIPVFLEKLQVIQCMDVAEQSLTALDMLSRKHSKAILQAHGVSACLMYIDFFSSGAQRAALSITSNCCQNLTADEFHFVAESLTLLSSRLTSQGDKKCVESVCSAYSRLVDCFQNDPNRLQEIAGHNLLANIQQLLVMSPPVLSTATFIMVMRMMSLMCANCPELAVTLLKNNIAETLCYLLTSSAEPPKEQVELVSRSPQELYEITCLIGELMPSLPSEGMFAIDSALQRPVVSVHETICWQWQDDRASWQNFSLADSRIFELAQQFDEGEVSFCISGRTYTIDFHSMQQINDNTGTMRAVQRRVLPVGTATPIVSAPPIKDARATCLENDSNLSSSLIRSLFSLLYEVYSSSAGPAVRYKCLRALLRMVHFSSPELLQQVLKSQAVSSHLATMLSSLDLKIIVGALQMADLLMNKLPDVFAIYFRREGVMHQIKRLCDPETTFGSSAAALNAKSAPDIGSGGSSTPSSASPLLPGRTFNGNCLDGTPSSGGSVTSQEDEKLNSPQIRLSDVLKRKRPKTANRMHTTSSVWRKTRQEDNSATTFSEFLMKNTRENWRSGSRNKLVSGSNSATSTPPTSGRAHNSTPSASGRTSFLSNLNPVRWGRCNSSSSTPTTHLQPATKERTSASSIIGSSTSSTTTNTTASSTMGLISSAHNSNREIIRSWVREQALKLNERHFTTELEGATHPALTVLNRLIAAIHQLEYEPSSNIAALNEISKIVSESDISPFEVIHSGLVRSLLSYLTAVDSNTVLSSFSSFSLGSNFFNVFGNSNIGDNGSVPLSPSVSTVVKTPRETRLRNFLHVFLGCSLDPLNTNGFDLGKVQALSALISKLNGCVNQLEQFPVKVHDLPGSSLAGSGRGGSTSAIKFFNTHQLKCNLQRHPDCSRLRQWRGGPVKVDPLALVQAIERYLVVRGYGRVRDDDEDNSDDDNSDEDIDDTLAAVSVNQSSSSHKLEFIIGDIVLPYNMTVYQAIRQFSSNDASTSEVDTDTEMPVSQSAIWLQTHTIYYRPVQESEQSSSTTSRSGRKGKTASSKPSPKKKHDAVILEGSITGGNKSVLENQLTSNLPTSVTVRDPSLEVLALLRVLYALNRHFGLLYPPAFYKPPIPISEFNNMKLTAKANRQLQDPLVIMTGNLPQWLPQIAYACPFLFPFETRQLLFYAVSFDRDRALQRLIDSAPELNPSDSSERVTPRLERRKRTVSRDDILKQAEAVITDLASSRAMLEIQYDNEVGTGLGPTLEFYALVSKELLKADLELWRGETITVVEGAKEQDSSKITKYVSSTTGLYPLPLSKSTKFAYVTKIKSKFRFLGKFMAKAVMDSRMLDLGLHECVYKWLLGEEQCLTLSDVISLDPEIGATLKKLYKILLEKRSVQDKAKGENITSSELQERLENLTMEGCSIEDLSLNFTLPGYDNIDLKKGGSDITVTINNLEQYLQLVVDWFLRDGVNRQMDALKEGFECVFPLTQLQVFYPEELEQLFCGASDKALWDMKQLAECCRPDHGYNHDSKSVKYLLEILSSYSGSQQRSFLQFVTGSPRLPVGGFRSLTPALTIVRKAFDAGENPDNYLPSVMTCVNYLKLPDYSTKEIMRAKLDMAAREGQHSFHLS